MTDPRLIALALFGAAVLLVAFSWRASNRKLRLAAAVAAAWLAAIALLVGVLPLVVETPGYEADHKG